ncbi:hypothetical protein [Streptomyces sp. NPDC048106]|uniref:hypothetical protein n=1 Tax=Streptomyces sp. NPDC048106 TaxID=3155750 RepID=UPI003452862A
MVTRQDPEVVRRTAGCLGEALDDGLRHAVERCLAPVRDRGRASNVLAERHPGVWS